MILASQALANRGSFVARMGGPVEDALELFSTAKEGPTEMGFYLELITKLDRAALIDPTRVGLHGFRRTYYHVKYTLAFGGMHFKAAAVSDDVDFWYLRSLEVGYERESTGAYGGALPVGAGPQTYLRWAPDFQADKIDTAAPGAIGPRAPSASGNCRRS
jgi:hypothetical protein